MGKRIEIVSFFLWALVFVVGAFSYAVIDYSNHARLVEACDEDNHNAQNMSDLELSRLLSDLNKLRSSNEVDGPEAKNSDLKWIDSCAGWVMVEMRSRSFEKKLPMQADPGKR